MATFSFRNLLRPNIRTLQPYPSARSEFSGRADIFLNANENAFGSPFSADDSATGLPADLHRYPDPLALAVKDRYAAVKGCSPEQIFLGLGSDEAIDILLRMFCVPGHDRIIITPPTFVMYASYCAIHDIGVCSVPLIEHNGSAFQLDVPAILSAIDDTVKLIFLCSPNNPTGNLMAEEDMLTIIRTAPCMVVVDEAYIEFADRASLLARLDEFPNLIILQTFSKAWGLAGVRLGSAFASGDVIATMNAVKSPYNLNVHTQEIACAVLDRADHVTHTVQALHSERLRLLPLLREIPCITRVHESSANFILTETMDDARVYAHLLQSGIVVRLRKPDAYYRGGVRITVGTPEENTALLIALRTFDV